MDKKKVAEQLMKIAKEMRAKSDFNDPRVLNNLLARFTKVDKELRETANELKKLSGLPKGMGKIFTDVRTGMATLYMRTEKALKEQGKK